MSEASAAERAERDERAERCERAERHDPRGLIREAYRIEGIGEQECRSIFLDWLLSAPEDPPVEEQIAALLHAYAPGAPEHPMNAVLRAGLAPASAPKGRRGGWRAKRAP